MKKIYTFLLAFVLAFAAQNLYAQTLTGGGPCYNLTETDAICSGEDYTFPDGWVANITAQVVHTSHLQTVVTQCDSIIETTVNPLPAYNRTETFFNICPGDVYTFPDGTVQTIMAHTEYTSMLQTVGSLCDSNILTILNTNDLNPGVTVQGNVITAVQGNAGYQWVDCNNNYAPVIGEGNQSFTAPDGNFAVIIFKGACTDTSVCTLIGTVGINDLNSNTVTVYPNPTNGFFKVNLGSTYSVVNVTIRNMLGQQIQLKTLRNVSVFDTNIEMGEGIYFLELQGSEGLHARYKIVKE